jgi:hypothetical protein
VSLQVARVDWERGSRELEEHRDDPPRYRRLLSAADVVTDELRSRVGQTFTLAQLHDAYADAERWARPAVSERAPYDGWPRDLSLVVDAAFHAYARGAADFEP